MVIEDIRLGYRRKEIPDPTVMTARATTLRMNDKTWMKRRSIVTRQVQRDTAARTYETTARKGECKGTESKELKGHKYFHYTDLEFPFNVQHAQE